MHKHHSRMYLYLSKMNVDTAAKEMIISWILLMSSITELVGEKVGPEYQTAVKYCVSKSQCDLRNHEICWWSYNGCARGQCMCDPKTHFKDKHGKCRKLKQGKEPCNEHDRCPDGMACTKNTCECIEGEMTLDRKVCLKHNEKLLGEICTPSTDICYQLSAQQGYTSREVECSHFEYTCKCKEGYKEDLGECRKWKINEPGCSRDHHCQGGALCIDGTCRCPTGYRAVSHDSKCAKEGAATNLGIGASCDEINERRYCARNLVCHKCLGDSYYTCVQCMYPTISEAKQQRFFADDSASSRVHSSSVLLVLVLFLGTIHSMMS